MVGSGWILICEGADAPVIMGISDPADLYSPLWEVILLNSLFVGVDVSSRNHFAYLMRPDGDKYCSFPLRNTPSDAKLLSNRIVSALDSLQLTNVSIGLEATSIYGDGLVYALREDGSQPKTGPKLQESLF